jgi:hypothetical protein
MKVEDDLINRLESKCKENKQSRSSFLGMAKKYADDSKTYEQYLKKAEDVDMSFCTTLKKDKEIIQKSRGRSKGRR